MLIAEALQSQEDYSKATELLQKITNTIDKELAENFKTFDTILPSKE